MSFFSKAKQEARVAGLLLGLAGVALGAGCMEASDQPILERRAWDDVWDATPERLDFIAAPDLQVVDDDAASDAPDASEVDGDATELEEADGAELEETSDLDELGDL